MPNKLPQMTEEQREAGLAKARETRKARHEFLEAIKNGDKTIDDALESDEKAIQRIFVRQLLCAVPGIGKAKAAKIMTEIGIHENRRVGGLGPRQRQKLHDTFAETSADK